MVFPTQFAQIYHHCISSNNTYKQYTNNESKKYTVLLIVATIAHELAHYLQLFHTFSNRMMKDLIHVDTDYCDELQPYDRKHIAIGCKSYIESRTA